MKQFLVIIILFSGVVFSNAQEQSNSVKKNIFENLATQIGRASCRERV